MIYQQIKEKLRSKKLFVVLIDPESYDHGQLTKAAKYIDTIGNIDMLFVGGSLVSKKTDDTIETIKAQTKKPVISFPGSLLQISNKADAMLLLSLISGRNPDLLIGNHVIAAPYIKNNNLEAIPTGYILIGTGNISAVQYMSNTLPIPEDKTDLILATALAGEMLGLKLIYLEAGSGAAKPVSLKAIEMVKKHIQVPVIVGGGIKTKAQVDDLYNAGVDIIVVGNSVEQDIRLLEGLF